MNTGGRVHLDHAATSRPKAPGVVDAITDWYERLGVSASRGDGPAHREVAERVEDTRRRVGALVGMPAERIAFCSGATEALHLAFGGLIRPGARIVTTALEHAAVARPLVALREQGTIDLEIVPTDSPGSDHIDPNRVADALSARPTDLLVCTSASNVTGVTLDVEELCGIARTRAPGCRVVCDASQTAGVLPVPRGPDVVVASAHKSLLGPPGLGFLAVRSGLSLAPIKLGGTGSSVALDRQPMDWPAAFEAGTPNTPAILGLGAALQWRETASDEETRGESAARACAALQDALQSSRLDVRTFGTERPGMPILSFAVEGFDVAETGMLLEAAGLDVRTGYHCAPWIHDAIGSTRFGGTVRVSPGPFVSAADVLRVRDVLVDS